MEYDQNLDRQRALALCWISVGSALKHYAHIAGLPRGHGPLAPAIRLRDRLAHQPVDRLNPAVLWETSVRDAPELARIIAALRWTCERRIRRPRGKSPWTLW